MHWQTSRFQIDLTRPQVMGIVNVTPDSFSDGGLHATTADALRHCEALIRQGADLLDIGGESTRPGATPLSAADELARVLPVLREAVRLGVPISVDTYKPEVMQAALDLGADIINDIWALRWRDPANGLAGADVVGRHPRCGICLMHMHGEPTTMQRSPMDGDVLPEVLLFLQRQAQALLALGVEKARILLDPGPGFGKTVAQNFSLLSRQRELLALGYPLLAAWSRKSSLAAMATPAAERVAGTHERLLPSVAAALIAVERGARVVRVHDVSATVQALKVWTAASQG
ncbi:dihydropteroate synthase [Rhodoferax koreense]|uniref:Dihydropteroate synthase n=1 Tax=Rhodoferax koreensis TaxID=1842727 RepID=A0A1P8JZQ0_9BURK|nr:dihydropteroate synthase [Rhodoferax koreense]APW39161.1 dihydropteroate synthase [Rhodoferax koreense]